jgi:hypothetical protein
LAVRFSPRGGPQLNYLLLYLTFAATRNTTPTHEVGVFISPNNQGEIQWLS